MKTKTTYLFLLLMTMVLGLLPFSAPYDNGSWTALL